MLRAQSPLSSLICALGGGPGIWSLENLLYFGSIPIKPLESTPQIAIESYKRRWICFWEFAFLKYVDSPFPLCTKEMCHHAVSHIASPPRRHVEGPAPEKTSRRGPPNRGKPSPTGGKPKCRGAPIESDSPLWSRRKDLAMVLEAADDGKNPPA